MPAYLPPKHNNKTTCPPLLYNIYDNVLYRTYQRLPKAPMTKPHDAADRIHKAIVASGAQEVSVTQAGKAKP